MQALFCLERGIIWSAFALRLMDSLRVGRDPSWRRDMAQVKRVKVVGPLEPFQPGFEALLAGMGYTPRSVVHQLWLVKHLSVWLEERDLAAADLAPDVVRAFLACRQAEGYVRFPTERALAPLLGYLRELGVAPVPAAPVVAGQLPELIERYRRYLAVERGLTAATMAYYLLDAQSFLARWVGKSSSRLSELDAAGVVGFVTDECARRSPSSAKQLTTVLRSLLRFLVLDGSISADLRGAVPTVARWRGSHLPRAITPAQADALLASCSGLHDDAGRSPAGGAGGHARRAVVIARRDRAILLLLVRLGLRAVEVTRLQLDDLDWRRGELTVCGKARRDERLPLPVDVGEAIVDYLRHRPIAATRAVFIRVIAPHTAFTSQAVESVVGRAARRAGLTGISAHRLRHGAATQLLRTGSSLTEVGQVLRHRDIVTTAVYAKVDRARLQELARPWPGASR
jgi:integrase/recombinase XerD